MRTTIGWICFMVALLGALTWAVWSFSYGLGFAEGQRVQDAAIGDRVDALSEAVEELGGACRGYWLSR